MDYGGTSQHEYGCAYKQYHWYIEVWPYTYGGDNCKYIL